MKMAGTARILAVMVRAAMKAAMATAVHVGTSVETSVVVVRDRASRKAKVAQMMLKARAEMAAKVGKANRDHCEPHASVARASKAEMR